MERFSFHQLCRIKFCTYGVTFKVPLHCFDQTTGRFILTKTEKKTYSFMCQRCLLKTYIDFNVAFFKSVMTTNTKKMYTE